jgi:transposase-like protein
MGHYQKRTQGTSKSGEALLVELRLNRRELQQMIEEGLYGLALEIGVEVAMALLVDEVEGHCGPVRKRDGQRRAYRHGRERGWIAVGGAKAAIERPRVRTIDDKEVPLQRYQAMQQPARQNGVMRRLVRGVSCRNYRAVVDAIRKGYGVSASSVSRSFVAASEARVRELAERRFDGMRFAAIFIDGICFSGRSLIAAVGVTESGEKRVLAVREGATENARVCTDLLEDLRERGVDTNAHTLFVLDGSKALQAAVNRVWGERAEVQRCQQHKLRNVASYVPEQHWPDISTAIRKAYAETSYKKAKKMLETVARWLDRINPHAAASLREGLDETLTVARLGLKGRLRRSFATTNLVEAIFARTRMMTGRVKRWRDGSMRQRWCATALLHAETTFRAVNGCSDMPQLLAALDRSSAKLCSVA